MKTSEKLRKRRYHGINLPNEGSERQECVLCGYIYDESLTGVSFADLPGGYVCPLCLAGKEYFEKI